jgi:hypothetical protein
MLSLCANLQSLNLKGNRFGCLTIQQWQTFGEVFSSCRKLESINLGHNDLNLLTTEQWQAFGMALSKGANLQRLNLGGNGLGPLILEPWQACCAALSECVNLQSIDLNFNYLNCLTVEQWQVFGTALSTSANLQSINLEYNNLITLKQWQVLGLALSSCTNLQSISLRHNALGLLDTEQWQIFCNVFNDNSFKSLYSVKFEDDFQKYLLAQFYQCNLQIVNLPTGAESLAYNNRYVLLRYYSSLINFLSTHANHDVARTIFDYVNFPHKKIINHLFLSNSSKAVLFTTKSEYEKIGDNKQRVILIDNDANNLIKQNFMVNKTPKMF